ncbi:unnamed protein product [Euphydryas editha]|uniref:Uncharacterized protein n=1 Tax=Euphydryas editha TaxID=104508 RepID=A0AAU9TB50_EUPED|nr:unnamed protein product [Euphydryas editha]
MRRLLRCRWTDEELYLLARVEAQLTTDTGKCANVDLLAKLPQLQRTPEAIKGQRRSAKYKGLVKGCLEEIALSASGPASRGSITEQPVEERVLTAESTSEVAQAQDPAIAVDVPLSPKTARVLETLLAGAERRVKCSGRGAENAKRHRRTFRKQTQDDSTPGSGSRRKLRRAKNARVQELFRKYPSRAAAEVLDTLGS